MKRLLSRSFDSASPRFTRATGLRSFAALLASSLLLAAAPLDIAPLQELIDQGKAAPALEQLAASLEKDPDNERLLYDHGVAAYAAGNYEAALVSLDRVEYGRSKRLVARARFQKGNAEFRLGLAARSDNLDETITRWKQSLDHYRENLKTNPDDAPTLKNFETVRRLLMALLLDTARKSQQASRQERIPDKQIQQLRNAHEKYTDATQTDSQNQEAKSGEQQTREELARALAKEGTKKSEATNLIAPTRNQPPVTVPDIPQIEEGVNMIEDAQSLLPKDAEIERQLLAARERLANALNLQARRWMAIERQLAWNKEKLAVLRMAKESVGKALDQVPNHEPSKQTEKEINERLAQVHEEQGDEMAQQGQSGSVENQAMNLSQALDNYQQASGLKPEESRLQQKATKTQSQLESALDRLAGQLMKPKPGESIEQEAARLEGAEQALNELQALNPSDKTAERAQQVSEQLEGVRQRLAQQGKPAPQQGSGQLPGPSPQLAQQGLPTDAPPRINAPGQRGGVVFAHDAAQPPGLLSLASPPRRLMRSRGASRLVRRS